MKFNKLVAVIAISGLALQANAYSDGTLRRSVQVAQNDTISESQPTQGVVIMNSNTNSNSAAAIQQPTTVVEAAPVGDSRADFMRKARQNEEVKTEQKIVEKLEESRLKEEQQRAERLFGNRLEAPAAATATATATAIVAEPKQEEPKVVAPTQVTIEKVEIIQPKEEKEEKLEPVEATSKMQIEEEKEEEGRDKLFVSGILASPNYSASNVKSNFGLGFSVGVMLMSNWALEGTFLYSNHSMDTYWRAPLYTDLDQYDISASAKYYILSGRLKPYAGASVTYIYRKYQERLMQGSYYAANPVDTEESTNALNAGILAGVDFQINEKIMIGAGVDYNFNVMNRSDFQSQYGVPSDLKPLEEIDYTVLKINAKMTF